MVAAEKEAPKKTCFVISPIGEAGSQTRNRSDLVFEFVIKAVLAAPPFDFVVERSDKVGEPGIITNQIINRVIDADLVVADLSERNPNVFYELAIRHIARKPYVHLVSLADDIPFDNAAARAIPVEVTDLRSVDAAKRELALHVESALGPDAKIESPISTALTLMNLKKTDGVEALVLQDVLDRLSLLQSSMSVLSKRIDNVRDYQSRVEGTARHTNPQLFSHGSAVMDALNNVGRISAADLTDSLSALPSRGNAGKMNPTGRK